MKSYLYNKLHRILLSLISHTKRYPAKINIKNVIISIIFFEQATVFF